MYRQLSEGDQSPVMESVQPIFFCFLLEQSGKLGQRMYFLMMDNGSFECKRTFDIHDRVKSAVNFKSG